MRVLEAVRLIRAGALALPELWAIATKAERVQVALILGLPAELPVRAATPELAWKAMNAQQRGLVLRHAPLAIVRRLPSDPATGRRIVWRRYAVEAVATCSSREEGGRARQRVAAPATLPVPLQTPPGRAGQDRGSRPPGRSPDHGGGSPSTGTVPRLATSDHSASCTAASAVSSVPFATSATPRRPSGRSYG